MTDTIASNRRRQASFIRRRPDLFECESSRGKAKPAGRTAGDATLAEKDRSSIISANRKGEQSEKASVRCLTGDAPSGLSAAQSCTRQRCKPAKTGYAAKCLHARQP